MLSLHQWLIFNCLGDIYFIPNIKKKSDFKNYQEFISQNKILDSLEYCDLINFVNVHEF